MTVLKGLIFMGILFVAWVIAVFAFSQIIGVIKYRMPLWFVTILIWGGILIAGIAITNAWLSDYSKATYIAYVIGFVMSLGVKKDNA